MRDYLKWHDAYDDPNSDLSWRLRQAQTYIRQALDHLPGPVTVLSRCAGDGRDVLQVLADRDDFSRVRTTLMPSYAPSWRNGRGNLLPRQG